MRSSVAAMLLAWACAGVPAQARDAVVEQPRPFGYTVGDIATQRVLLPEDITPAALPDAARASAWLERRPARIERGADGRRWLVVEYQVVNAPRALATVPVPAWELAGTPPLRVAAAAISVGPLTSPMPAGQPLLLRPDRPAPAIAIAPIQRRLWQWAGALAALLGAWLAYTAWNSWRDRNALPFGRALRELRGQAGVPLAAHVVLHQAFDRTAGQVVQAGTLAALFQRAPWLQPRRTQIVQFYAQSAGLFFGGGLPADAVSPQALCRQLHRLERRHVA